MNDPPDLSGLLDWGDLNPLDLGVEHDTSLRKCNAITFFYEDFSRPVTYAERERWAANDRRRNRLDRRVRRGIRHVRFRLRDTWGVLLHGLPERDDW